MVININKDAKIDDIDDGKVVAVAPPAARKSTLPALHPAENDRRVSELCTVLYSDFMQKEKESYMFLRLLRS